MENLDKIGRPDLVYARVKEITTEKRIRYRNIVIKDQRGVLLTEPEEIRQRWKEYTELLYDMDGKPKIEEMNIEREEEVGKDAIGPSILESEIRAAIQEMKNKKSEGIDNIPAELLKSLGEKATEELVKLCQQMYERGEWPDDFTKTIIVPMEKKTNAVECEDFRTISLIPHASKIILKVLAKRITTKAEQFLGKNQFGFRKGCGTREAIGVMRMLCERSLEFNNNLYLCFVDFEKAFDRVRWTKLMDILEKIGVDWRDRRLICNLYINQEAIIRVGNGDSRPATIGQGLRQGCLLSPILFLVYSEMMMIEAMDGIEEGVKVGGKLIKDIRYADDQGMTASSEEGLQRLMDALHNTAKEYNMKINMKKTKVMRISREGVGAINIVIDGIKLEQVDQFRYLGSLITSDGRCEQEIKTRIGMAKAAFIKRQELLSKSLCTALRKRMVKSLVWSVALYASETWTLRQEDIKRLQAFEMWVWRRMEKVSWRDKKTNEEVLEAIGEKRSLMDMIYKRKKNWIGHITRGDSLMKDVIEGRMIGKRPPGRRRYGMLRELSEGSYATMKRRAEERSDWRNWLPETCQMAEH